MPKRKTTVTEKRWALLYNGRVSCAISGRLAVYHTRREARINQDVSYQRLARVTLTYEVKNAR